MNESDSSHAPLRILVMDAPVEAVERIENRLQGIAVESCVAKLPRKTATSVWSRDFDGALCWFVESQASSVKRLDSLVAQSPELRVIAVGDRDSAASAVAALRHGACDYVCLATDDAERLQGALFEAIRDGRRREAETSRRRQERLAAMGMLTAGIAHEINNPIGAALLTAETVMVLLEQDASGPQVQECLENIVAALERCGQIVKNILRFAGDGSSEKAAVDSNAMVLQGHELVRAYAHRRQVAIELDLAEDLPRIHACGLEIELLLVNILRNAVEACSAPGRIVVRTTRAGDLLELVVKDDGRGMSDEQLQHIFDPFHSSRRDAGGTGLGMSIAYGVVQEHGGTIEVASLAGEGTTVTVRLPTISDSDDAASD